MPYLLLISHQLKNSIEILRIESDNLIRIDFLSIPLLPQAKNGPLEESP